MKILFLSIIILISYGGYSNAQIDSQLLHRIRKMVDKDQAARLKIDSTTATYGYKSTQMKDLWSYITAIDNSHNSELKRLVKKAGGYPGYNMLGEKGSDNFWLLVQHQDLDTAFQKEVLVLMKMAVDKKQASGKYYAYLLDRVNLNTGKKQVYGTQFEPNKEKGNYEPRPLEDPENVNKRRADVGLGPIEEIIEYLNKKSTMHLKK